MAETQTERRQHPRTEVALTATVERVGGRPLSGGGWTIDVSEGGARLRGPGGFGVGDVVKVTLSADDVAIDQQGLVVGRQNATGGEAILNVAFKTLDEERTIDLRRLLERG